MSAILMCVAHHRRWNTRYYIGAHSCHRPHKVMNKEQSSMHWLFCLFIRTVVTIKISLPHHSSRHPRYLLHHCTDRGWERTIFVLHITYNINIIFMIPRAGCVLIDETHFVCGGRHNDCSMVIVTSTMISVHHHKKMLAKMFCSHTLSNELNPSIRNVKACWLQFSWIYLGNDPIILNNQISAKQIANINYYSPSLSSDVSVKTVLEAPRASPRELTTHKRGKIGFAHFAVSKWMNCSRNLLQNPNYKYIILHFKTISLVVENK